MEYREVKFVTATGSRETENLLNALITDGWKLFGTVVVTFIESNTKGVGELMYTQTVVR